MPSVHLGRKDEPPIVLEESRDLIAVRTRSRRALDRTVRGVRAPISEQLADAQVVVMHPEAGVTVYRVPIGRGERSLKDRKDALRLHADVRFAGGVLIDPTTHDPVLYTENLFVKFVDALDPDEALVILRNEDLTVKDRPTYAENAFFVAAPEGTGQRVFDVAARLLARPDVEFCHPELIRARARKSIWARQWHLAKTEVFGVMVDAHANVASAHEVTRGEGVTIAVIDDGVDIDHPEFARAGKVVWPRDATLRTDDPRPRDEFGTGPDDGDNHGTACAGVACADGVFGASGVAPAARLMPIRLASGLGSQREAEAFQWAADHGADVISCSWGPADGAWWNAADPRHRQESPLPASTRLAIDYATTRGRGGRGCVVLFAAGNGNESVDLDGYARYEGVLAVAACNDRGKRSVYSDFGKAVACAFPSSDFGHPPFQHPEPLTPGIWTTDRRGTDGYNDRTNGDGDAAGQFTGTFGGTSSACPGAAGVAALILASDPELPWRDVKRILMESADRIDPVGGAYDSDGHSDRYGHGRVNARSAVDLAQPRPKSAVTITRTFDLPLPDLATVDFPLTVAETARLIGLRIQVDLAHTYVGDLVITVAPPDSLALGPVTLQSRVGGPKVDLHRVFDATSTPALTGFVGQAATGIWTLRIEDAAALDSGRLASWALHCEFEHPETPRAVAPAGKRSVRPPTAPRVRSTPRN